MTNKNLRSLAKDYANGVLNKESYRKARDELFQGILSGKIAVLENEYRRPLEVEDMDITRDKTAIMSAPPEKKPRPTTEFVPPDPPPSSSPLKLILITSIIAAICVIVIIVLFSKTGQQENEKDTLADTTEKHVITSVQQNNAGQALIKNFLKQNNWTDDSLQQFITEWNNLSDAERVKTLSSPIKTQLANAISRQLLEERALFSLGGDRSSVIARQRSLVNFAGEMDINDPRITVQELDEIQSEATTQEETVAENTSSAEVSIAGTDTTNAQENATEEVAVKTEEAVVQSADMEKTDVPTAEESPAPENPVTKDTTLVQELPPVTEEIKPSPAPEPVSEISSKTTSESATTSSVAKTKTKSTTTTNKHACRASLAKQRQPYCRDIIDNIGKGPTLVVVPGGKFMMGGEKPQELPKHEVVISKPFAIAVNEITSGEYEQFCNDSQRNCPQQPWADKEYPVVNVSWNDAVAYTNWLSAKTGNQYRLPSEAEWEYAARARTTTKYPFGDEILLTDAVFSSIKPLTSPLPRSDRSINRNKFRLYHMAGNVREWVLDSWSENYNNAPADGSAYTNASSDSRVVRGGSYADNDDALRSGARFKLPVNNADEYTGFRIVQELTQ